MENLSEIQINKNIFLGIHYVLRSLCKKLVLYRDFEPLTPLKRRFPGFYAIYRGGNKTLRERAVATKQNLSVNNTNETHSLARLCSCVSRETAKHKPFSRISISLQFPTVGISGVFLSRRLPTCWK
jgi:hypothetical protein